MLLPADKMGQDVKALGTDFARAFISRSDDAARVLAHPIVAVNWPCSIAVGRQEPRQLSDAKRIYNSLDRFHTDETKQDLIFIGADTSLQGGEIARRRRHSIAAKDCLFYRPAVG